MSERCLIFGVESSCDETSCAVVADGRDVLSNAVASQVELHARYGGVVPEIASRAHIEAINPMIDEALATAGAAPGQIAAVAVTSEPGLIGSLLVGLMAAKTLAWAWGKPLIGVNHVHAHAYAAALNARAIEYPAVALICSGGHTALYHCMAPAEMALLGATIDDAAGEAFDKVATILNLGFPGGPAIDRVAREGNPRARQFPRSLLKGDNLDFSFSGLKTAVLYDVNGIPAPRGRPRRQEDDRRRGIESLSAGEVADIAASFQAAVVDVLCRKLALAAERVGARSVILGGGVAANSALRQAAEELAGRRGWALRLPQLDFCMDNAAMIAGLGYHHHRAGRHASLDLTARATVSR